jgi:hypothetical protein
VGLSDKETKMLERLMKKKDEPDPPAASRALNISIDLGDEKQVERAQKLGLLSMLTGDDDADDDGNDDDGNDDDDDEDVPRRRGYFKGDK